MQLVRKFNHNSLDVWHIEIGLKLVKLWASEVKFWVTILFIGLRSFLQCFSPSADCSQQRAAAAAVAVAVAQGAEWGRKGGVGLGLAWTTSK